MGCREAQGYLIAKPMKPDALDAFLKARSLEAKA
jgi:EAL domain-containing protein (putative c-di-GMP-specific phosphodiesterase class I)